MNFIKPNRCERVWCTCDCVEVAFTPECVTLRDPQGRTVEYTYREWLAFILDAKQGQFDIPEEYMTDELRELATLLSTVLG